MIRGLFIGIDRYSSPVTRLSCATNDARALSALFEDTVDGPVTVLLDADASRARILEELTALRMSEPDDLVVVSFSGHGTDDHLLVPVDVDVEDLTRSCISLKALAVALDAIPGHLLVFLDCCFSGGFGGARVFAPTSERSMFEDRTVVAALAGGSGRVVVTASAAGEPALETTATGHGIFTHHLLSALQGQDQLGENGRIRWLALFDVVTRNVVEEARRLGAAQTPTVYGSLDGVPSLPRLFAGVRYAEQFPNRVRSPASSDWASLASFGFSEAMLERWARSIPSLNQLQLDAVNDFGVLDGKSVLVSAPTGAGKTLIGELAAFKAVATGSRAAMLLPLKALVNEKYAEFTSVYGDEAVVVRATGDHSDQVGAILNGQYDLALLTYEKFLNLALTFPHVLRGLSVVVVDEAQTISDPNRGPALEFLLALLRSGFARGAPVQIVALSAVMGATNGLETWLGGGLLRTTERPVPLTESVVDQGGNLRSLHSDGTETESIGFVQAQFSGGSQSSKPWIIPVVQRLVGEGKKVIVFRSIKGETVGTAGYLADVLNLPSADETLALLPTGDMSDASNQLRGNVARGVGFHNSDLDSAERTALEVTFRNPDSPLRVLVATTTLAMGLNTPAEAVVIAGLTHPFANAYSVAEYKNMAGRAGRPGLAEAGEAYIIATGDIGPMDAWLRYVKSEPEPVTSHFLSSNTDPKTLIVRSLVALGSNVEEPELVALLEGSFAVWQRIQQGAAGWDLANLRRDLESLIQAGLLDREPSGKLTLTELGRYAGESGIEVESVANVASILRFAPATLGVADALVIAQVTVEMDQQYIPANKKSIQEKQRWPNTMQQLGADVSLLRNLHVGGGDSFARTKRAVAATYFASSRTMATIEQELLQHYRGRSCAGPVRATSSRTRDVLDAVIRIATISGKTISDEIAEGALGIRLEIGLPAELVDLAQYLGLERIGGQVAR